jgi:hypothetical protein
MLVTLLACSNVMLVAAAVHNDCSGWSTLNTDKCTDAGNDCCISMMAVQQNSNNGGVAENTAMCESGYYPSSATSIMCGPTTNGQQTSICYDCPASLDESDLAWLVVLLIMVFVVIPICLVVAVCFCGVALCSKGKPAATPQTGQPQTIVVQQPGQPQMMAIPGAQQQQPQVMYQQQPVMVQQPQYAVQQ